MAPSLLSAGGGYYYGEFENQIRRSRSRTPFVKIEELDSNDAVISRKNYSYTASSLSPYTLFKGLSYTIPYTAPSTSLVTSDYFPYRTSYYSFPRQIRSYYPTYNDMSYYLARLLPYYYHPRPVHHTTYAPHYHYTYETPRTRITRTTRTYHVPAIMPSYNYSYALTTGGYYY